MEITSCTATSTLHIESYEAFDSVWDCFMSQWLPQLLEIFSTTATDNTVTELKMEQLCTSNGTSLVQEDKTVVVIDR